MGMNLVEFLNARLDQDERPVVTARMRREIEAKRAIIGWHVPLEDCEPPQCIVCLEHMPCRTLRAIAAVWDNYPGYRQEWKP